MYATILLGSRLVGGGGVTVSTGGLRGVDGGALVGDVGDESVLVVGGVGGGLDPAVGESDHEASGDNTSGILGLGLLEVGLAVVVSHAVLVGERLRGELLGDIGGGLVVGGGGGVGRGAVSGDEGDEGSGDNNLQQETLNMFRHMDGAMPTLNA